MALQRNFLQVKNQLLNNINFTSGLLFEYDRQNSLDIIYENKLNSSSNNIYIADIQKVPSLLKENNFDFLDLSGLNYFHIQQFKHFKDYPLIFAAIIKTTTLHLNIRQVVWKLDADTICDFISTILDREIQYWDLQNGQVLCYLP